MIITKAELKVLAYIYKRKTVSYKSIKHRFSKYPNLNELMESLVFHNYIIQIGGFQTDYGSPIPITNETKFSMDSLGCAEVESNQWFNSRYVLSSLILPILVGVLSSVLTAFILALLK